MKLQSIDTYTTTSTGKNYGFALDAKNPELIIKIISDMYPNPRRTIMTEYVQNAVDSHRAAGTDVPVEVKLPTILAPNYVVRDYGTGMSEEFLEKTFRFIGASSKRENADDIGGFGMGKLVYGAYSGVMEIKCYDGTEVIHYLARLQSGNSGFQEMSREKSDEPKGVEISIPVFADDINYFWENAPFIYGFLGDRRPRFVNHDMPPYQAINYNKNSSIFDAYRNVFNFIDSVDEGENWLTTDDGRFSINLTCPTHGEGDTGYHKLPELLDKTVRQVGTWNVVAVVGGLPFPLNQSVLMENASGNSEKEAVNFLKEITFGMIRFKPDDVEIVPSRDNLKYNRNTCSVILDYCVKMREKCVRWAEEKLSEVKDYPLMSATIFNTLSRFSFIPKDVLAGYEILPGAPMEDVFAYLRAIERAGPRRVNTEIRDTDSYRERQEKLMIQRFRRNQGTRNLVRDGGSRPIRTKYRLFLNTPRFCFERVYNKNKNDHRPPIFLGTPDKQICLVSNYLVNNIQSVSGVRDLSDKSAQDTSDNTYKSTQDTAARMLPLFTGFTLFLKDLCSLGKIVVLESGEPISKAQFDVEHVLHNPDRKKYPWLDDLPALDKKSFVFMRLSNKTNAGEFRKMLDSVPEMRIRHDMFLYRKDLPGSGSPHSSARAKNFATSKQKPGKSKGEFAENSLFLYNGRKVESSSGKFNLYSWNPMGRETYQNIGKDTEKELVLWTGVRGYSPVDMESDSVPGCFTLSNVAYDKHPAKSIRSFNLLCENIEAHTGKTLKIIGVKKTGGKRPAKPRFDHILSYYDRKIVKPNLKKIDRYKALRDGLKKRGQTKCVEQMLIEAMIKRLLEKRLAQCMESAEAMSDAPIEMFRLLKHIGNRLGVLEHPYVPEMQPSPGVSATPAEILDDAIDASKILIKTGGEVPPTTLCRFPLRPEKLDKDTVNEVFDYARVKKEIAVGFDPVYILGRKLLSPMSISGRVAENLRTWPGVNMPAELEFQQYIRTSSLGPYLKKGRPVIEFSGKKHVSIGDIFDSYGLDGSQNPESDIVRLLSDAAANLANRQSGKNIFECIESFLKVSSILNERAVPPEDMENPESFVPRFSEFVSDKVMERARALDAEEWEWIMESLVFAYGYLCCGIPGTSGNKGTTKTSVFWKEENKSGKSVCGTNREMLDFVKIARESGRDLVRAKNHHKERTLELLPNMVWQSSLVYRIFRDFGKTPEIRAFTKKALIGAEKLSKSIKNR